MLTCSVYSAQCSLCSRCSRVYSGKPRCARTHPSHPIIPSSYPRSRGCVGLGLVFWLCSLAVFAMLDLGPWPLALMLDTERDPYTYLQHPRLSRAPIPIIHPPTHSLTPVTSSTEIPTTLNIPSPTANPFLTTQRSLTFISSSIVTNPPCYILLLCAALLSPTWILICSYRIYHRTTHHVPSAHYSTIH